MTSARHTVLVSPIEELWKHKRKTGNSEGLKRTKPGLYIMFC